MSENREWHRIHDFFRGWGLQEKIPDNQIVVEDHSDEPIPWKVVRSKQQERIIWENDCRRLLKVSAFSEGFDPEDAYTKLEPLLEEERKEFLKNYKPPVFDKITIPKINKLWPQLLL